MLAWVIVLAVVVVSGCGGDDDDVDEGTPTTQAPADGIDASNDDPAEEALFYDTRMLGYEDDSVRLKWVNGVVFSPDGRLLAAGGSRGDQGAVAVWDLDDDTQSAELSSDSSVTEVAFSPDGSLLVGGGVDGTVALWDVDTYEPLGTLSHDDPVASVSFSPDGDILAVATRSNEIVSLDVSDEQQAQCDELEEEFPADWPSLCEAPVDQGSVELWDPGSQDRLETILESKAVNAAMFSPDGQSLAITPAFPQEDDSLVQLWDPDAGELISRLFDPESSFSTVGEVAFSPEGQQLASSTGVMWDLSDGGLVDDFRGRHGDSSVAFSPDGDVVVTVGPGVSCSMVDSEAIPWHACSNPHEETVRGPGVRAVAYATDGTSFATGDGENGDVWIHSERDS